MPSLPLLIATGAVIMLLGLVVVVGLEVRARRVLARIGPVPPPPEGIVGEAPSSRTPNPLLAARLLMLLQIPLFLVGTSFYSLLNLMTLGLSDAVYAKPRWTGALLLTVALFLGSIAVPLVLFRLARVPRWWAFLLVLLTETTLAIIGLVGLLAKEGAAVLVPGVALAVPVVLLLLLPRRARRYFEVG